MMSALRDKVMGTILGLAIADSIGSPVEFVRSKKDILTLAGGSGIIDLPTPPLYTDDTQMTLCVANALIKSGRDIDTFMKTLSKEFLAWYELQKDPSQRRAPGNTCMAACENLKSGMHWEVSGIPASQGSGSAMRSAPIGLYHHGKVEKIVDFAISTSRITHSNELALCASVGTALLTHLAVAGEPVGMWGNELAKVASINPEFTSLLRRATKMAADGADPDKVLSYDGLGEGWDGHEAVASALYCCMMNPNSYEKAVLMAANTIGDSDTIACIAGAWMGARVGVNGIPEHWRSKIENAEGLMKTADELCSAAGIE